MQYRKHLFSIRLAFALRESMTDVNYSFSMFIRELMSGVTVGIIAIPLAMALAIAIGVAPQYGLYSAIIAGFLTPLLGGSRYSVSGPTAAFIVILYPIVQQYGLSGLLTVTVLSGVILLLMAILRLGRYIQYIPESVVLGFTGGIAVVIATLQINGFLGLNIEQLPESYLEKVAMVIAASPSLSIPTLIISVTTILIFVVWSKFRTAIPAHLPAVILASILTLIANNNGYNVATIGSTFHFTLSDGALGHGIPAILPDFEWPWMRKQTGESPLVFDWENVKDFLSAAFSIAMLGAIESLLCAVILDGMSGKKHSANSELLGQGISNIVAPFFGGITSTAAIARSAANFKAGAITPISAMIHAIFVLITLLSLTSLLAYLPMASMSALLLIVAWNMSEAPKIAHLLKKAPLEEIIIFIVCFSLTILFDMVIAITTGIVLASLLFMKQIAEMTRVQDISEHKKFITAPLPENWHVYKISGPLFFAAADRVFAELAYLTQKNKGVILYLDGVSILDSGGVSALNKFIDSCQKNQTQLLLADFQFQPLKTLAKAKFIPDESFCRIYASLSDALDSIMKSEIEQAMT